MYKDDNAPGSQSPTPSELEDGIRIEVRFDDNTSRMHFRIKYDMEMGRLKRSYCRQFKIKIDQVTFMAHGRKVEDGDTALTLDMSNSDYITVFHNHLL